MNARPDHAAPVPVSGSVRFVPAALFATTVFGLSSCGPGNTDEILRGGVPASTNLPLATNLPPESVRTVARRNFGWRLIYLPASAPMDAEQRAASALCGLERRRVSNVLPAPQVAAGDDPGTRKIDIFCV
ncbi:hypothetical protein [Paracoccus aerodenitrificans]|uniref:hypothetical protein n=1 Tax=Paracoccus aerodenitrificans TaxID=3017781 RepID=UPI0022F05456|nr:hypothetical protein [Paracoccus aerodenitrificans]WBU65073.1 hypothetical protein PAE61_06480 [Paracoccus aerodenitrificans]